MFLFVFITPTRIANAGNIVGDYITVALTVAGIILSIITMTKNREEEGIAILSFILSSSFLYFGSSQLSYCLLVKLVLRRMCSKKSPSRMKDSFYSLSSG